MTRRLPILTRLDNLLLSWLYLAQQATHRQWGASGRLFDNLTERLPIRLPVYLSSSHLNNSQTPPDNSATVHSTYSRWLAGHQLCGTCRSKWNGYCKGANYSTPPINSHHSQRIPQSRVCVPRERKTNLLFPRANNCQPYRLVFFNCCCWWCSYSIQSHPPVRQSITHAEMFALDTNPVPVPVSCLRSVPSIHSALMDEPISRSIDSWKSVFLCEPNEWLISHTAQPRANSSSSPIWLDGGVRDTLSGSALYLIELSPPCRSAVACLKCHFLHEWNPRIPLLIIIASPSNHIWITRDPLSRLSVYRLPVHSLTGPKIKWTPDTVLHSTFPAASLSLVNCR